MMQLRGNKSGLTLVELIVSVAILGILAAIVLPTTQMTAKRVKEMELRRNLRVIRGALDEYNATYRKAVKDGKMQDVVNKSGFPENLEILVEGYDFGGLYSFKKKFLRKIPADPFNPPKPGEKPEWGLRAYASEPGCSSNCEGDDVYDVYSLSEGIALDGTKYREW